MSSTKSRLLLLVVVFSLLAPTRVLCGQDVPPEWKRIRAALEKRREKFGRISYRLETTRHAPVSLYEGLEGDSSVTIKGKQDIHVDLTTGRIRHEDEFPRYSNLTKQFVTRRAVNVWDGKELFTFYPNHETQSQTGAGPFDLIKGDLKLNLPPLSSLNGWPLLWSFGFLQQSDFLNSEITNLPKLGFKFRLRENWVTATGQINPRTNTTIVFDESKDFCITQISVSKINGDRNQDTKFAYVERDGEWHLLSWKTTFRETGFQLFEVKNLQIHEQLEPELFKVPEDYLKPGMTYTDSSTPRAQAVYLVGPGGELKPLINQRGKRVVPNQKD